MTDHQEEMVALHALRTLTPDEERLLESESRYVPKMRETLAELEDTAAEIARLLPEEAPPEELRAQLLAQVKARARSNAVPFSAPLRLLRNPAVAWAAAAAIAVGAAGLWSRTLQLGRRVEALTLNEAAAQGEARVARDARLELEKKMADATSKISDLTSEVRRAKEGFALSSMEVMQLRSTLKRYEEGTALVVWNPEKQEGMLKLENMPEVLPNKDYQLWVICKECQHPVSAGVVKVGTDGTTAIPFKPAHHIVQALKFAISVEAQGGVAEKPEGPVIFASR